MGFYELAQSIKARRADDERKEREWAEAERCRKEREARQGAHAELIKQLERDAGAWHRARYLRRYVQAARRALVSDGSGDELCGEAGTRSVTAIRARFLEGSIDFLDWAEMYVNQLDPLNPEPRADEFQRNGSYHYVTEMDRFKDAFARLLGSDWPDAWKLGGDYTPDPSDRYPYREKSVFEIGRAGGDEG